MNLKGRIERLERARPAEVRHVEALTPWEQASALIPFYRRVAVESGVNLAGTVAALQRAVDSGDVSAMTASVSASAGSLEDLE